MLSLLFSFLLSLFSPSFLFVASTLHHYTPPTSHISPLLLAPLSTSLMQSPLQVLSSLLSSLPLRSSSVVSCPPLFTLLSLLMGQAIISSMRVATNPPARLTPTPHPHTHTHSWRRATETSGQSIWHQGKGVRVGDRMVSTLRCASSLCILPNRRCGRRKEGGG